MSCLRYVGLEIQHDPNSVHCFFPQTVVDQRSATTKKTSITTTLRTTLAASPTARAMAIAMMVAPPKDMDGLIQQSVPSLKFHAIETGYDKDIHERLQDVVNVNVLTSVGF